VPYALEHTVVEAFDGQLRADDHFGKFVEPIVATLDHHLPNNGYFALTFPINPSMGMKPKAAENRQNEIIAWVKTAALDLSQQATLLSSREIWRSPPTRNMPDSNITLEFREDSTGAVSGRLMAQRTAPANYEQLRQVRLNQAVAAKLPKLEKCRPSRTVLVLENRDGTVSNDMLIEDCLNIALNGRSDASDEVWLVDAVHSGFWVSICLRKDGVRFPYDNEAVRFHQFVPSQLSAA
jgi:hypothetical protein